MSDDESSGIDALRLEIFVVGSIIADLRIGKSNYLSGIAWISQDLLITRHRSVETNLTAGRGARPKTFAVKQGPVF